MGQDRVSTTTHCRIESPLPRHGREVVAMGLLSKKRFPKHLNRSDHSRVDNVLDLLDMKWLKNAPVGELLGGRNRGSSLPGLS